MSPPPSPSKAASPSSPESTTTPRPFPSMLPLEEKALPPPPLEQILDEMPSASKSPGQDHGRDSSDTFTSKTHRGSSGECPRQSPHVSSLRSRLLFGTFIQYPADNEPPQNPLPSVRSFKSDCRPINSNLLDRIRAPSLHRVWFKMLALSTSCRQSAKTCCPGDVAKIADPVERVPTQAPTTLLPTSCQILQPFPFRRRLACSSIPRPRQPLRLQTASVTFRPTSQVAIQILREDLFGAARDAVGTAVGTRRIAVPVPQAYVINLSKSPTAIKPLRWRSVHPQTLTVAYRVLLLLSA